MCDLILLNKIEAFLEIGWSIEVKRTVAGRAGHKGGEQQEDVAK